MVPVIKVRNYTQHLQFYIQLEIFSFALVALFAGYSLFVLDTFISSSSKVCFVVQPHENSMHQIYVAASRCYSSTQHFSSVWLLTLLQMLQTLPAIKPLLIWPFLNTLPHQQSVSELTELAWRQFRSWGNCRWFMSLNNSMVNTTVKSTYASCSWHFCPKRHSWFIKFALLSVCTVSHNHKEFHKEAPSVNAWAERIMCYVRGKILQHFLLFFLHLIDGLAGLFDCVKHCHICLLVSSICRWITAVLPQAQSHVPACQVPAPAWGTQQSQ